MGWHQGDALASFLFALTLQPIALLIKEHLPNLDLHAWFLDDGTEEELQQVVDIILREGPARGLHLSTSYTSTNPKSALWSPLLAANGGGNDDPLQRGVPLERGGGVRLLEAPIGQAEFVTDTVKRRERWRKLARQSGLARDNCTAAPVKGPSNRICPSPQLLGIAKNLFPAAHCQHHLLCHPSPAV